MKSELEEARDIINECDLELIKIYKKRMNAVRKVIHYKINNNMEVLDSKREHDLYLRNIEILDDKSLEKYYKSFFDGILKSSKDFQNDILKGNKNG